MFKSFFPNPKWFFISLLVWFSFTVGIWYSYNQVLGAVIGLDLSEKELIIGINHFTTDSFLLFYLYYFLSAILFAGFWFVVSPHKWQVWSILGSATILFSTYFSVQTSVAINNWYRPFFDTLTSALVEDNKAGVTASELYGLMWHFCVIAFVWVGVYVATKFLVSHFIFRWRTAMNDFYTEQWNHVKGIEGASQRVQEDTMRFAAIMESLGVSIIDSVMTLFAFLPVLLELSKYVKELPIIGEIAYPLLYAAIAWSIFGTLLLAFAGIKLPGLEFKNQRVEAAYRKELVYGEDDENRAQPETLKELFSHVRKNYFKLYFHYAYFNIARGFYIQADVIFALIILIPTVIIGQITYGIFRQITTAFSQVSSSFQYLVNSWTTIVDLISVYKRLQSFEAAIQNKPLSELDEA